MIYRRALVLALIIISGALSACGKLKSEDDDSMDNVSTETVRITSEVTEGISTEEMGTSGRTYEILISSNIQDPVIYDEKMEHIGVRLDLIDISKTGCKAVFYYNVPEEIGDVYPMSGYHYYLQKKTDDVWEYAEVKTSRDISFIDVGIPINDDSENVIEVKWDDIYGSLDSGEYRLILVVAIERNNLFPDNHKIFYIAKDFIIQ